MGLDELHLRVLATASDDTHEKRNAQKGEPDFSPHFSFTMPREIELYH